MALCQEREEKEAHDLRFARGATHLAVGPSGSGKTYRVCDILRLKNSIFERGSEIRNVVFCYAAWQPVYERLRTDGVVTRWVNKNPTSEEFVSLVKDYVDRGGSIVVIDDFMSSIGKDLMDIVTVQSRHHNASTFILFQSLFPPNKIARQVSLNVKYFHIFKNPRENAQIQTLARQLSPHDTAWIVEAYREITKEPHQCMLIDLTQGRNEKLRYRSHYLPREFPMRVWMRRGTAAI